MKTLLIHVARVYLFIGVFFASLLEISWVWSLLITLFTQFDAWFSIVGFIGFVVSIVVHLMFEPFLRALLWLPSMLSLLSPHVPIDFWQWMVPGFYDPLISVSKISQ